MKVSSQSVGAGESVQAINLPFCATQRERGNRSGGTMGAHRHAP